MPPTAMMRAGENEERDRQQREIVHAVGRLQHDRFERKADPHRRRRWRQARAHRRPACPCRQNTVKPPMRTRTSMGAAPPSYSVASVLVVSIVGSWNTLWRPHPLDHEQHDQQAADRHRQIGDADRDDRELGDALIPGGLDELDAPPEHEQVGDEHADFDERAEHRARRAGQHRRQDADADMQVFTVADDRRQERQPDHQQHGHRLGPGRGAVEDVAREHAPRDDERDDDEADAGDEQAGAVNRIHRAGCIAPSLPPPPCNDRGPAAPLTEPAGHCQVCIGFTSRPGCAG